MKLCTNCGAPYEAGLRHCTNCGDGLGEEEEPAAEWVEVYFGPGQWEGLVRRALEKAGIAARVPPDRRDLADAYMGNVLPAERAVFVKAEDLRAAQGVIAQLRKSFPDAFPEGQV